jgi:hypothetical protein
MPAMDTNIVMKPLIGSTHVCERWSVAGLAAVLAMAFSVWLVFGASMPADVHQALVVAPSFSAITGTSQ